MARVNVDILGISKLKWTGMGEFNLDEIQKYPLDKAIQKSVVNVAKGFQGDVGPDTRGGRMKPGETVSLDKHLSYEQER